MSKIKPPKKDAMLGHFLDKNWHTPTINGEIESSVGDRSGEAFKGRKYEGNGFGYVDLSTIVGVVTAKASWVKDDLNETNENSLTYEEYSIGVEPVIDLAINGSKHFVLDSGYSYHGIAIYENGLLYDFLTCEEGGELNAIGSITGNQYPIVNIISTDIHKEDSEVPFCFLNNKGYNVTTIEVPFSITNPNQDAFGNPLLNKGKVRSKLQLKQSYCLEGNGIWGIETGQTVTSLKVVGVEIIGDVTLSNGDAANSIVIPNIGVKLYDLVINNSSTIHYPCANNQLFIQDDDGGNPLTIINGVLVDVIGFTDVYHFNALNWIWQSSIDGSFALYKVDSNYVKFYGLEKTRMLPIEIESKIQFPDTPEVLAANIDFNQLFEVADFVNKNIPNTFSESKGNRVREIISYNLVLPSESPCFYMFNGESITFLNTTNWATFTHQGSGQFSLDLVGNKLDCVADGTIFNLKIFTVDGKWIKWFTFVDGEGTLLSEVIDTTQNGTLPNSAGWMPQKLFNYKQIYGSGTPKSFVIKPSDPYTQNNHLPNLSVDLMYQESNGNTYNPKNFSQDGNGNLILDAQGEPQGWVSINGEYVLNMYQDTNQPNTSLISGGNIIQINGVFPSAKLVIELEIMPGSVDLQSLTGRDSRMVGRFKDAFSNIHGISIESYISSVSDLFRCINGGENTTSSNYPNGTNPNYADNVLGITGIDRNDFISILDNDVFFNSGTAALFLEGLVDDGDDDNGASSRWNWPLTRSFSQTLGDGSSYYNIELTTDIFTATGGLGNIGNTFIINYENELESYSNMKLTLAYEGEMSLQWFRFKKLTIDEISQDKPAKYIGRLKRSSLTVSGNEIENINELKTKGDIAFKAMAFTKSEL